MPPPTPQKPKQQRTQSRAKASVRLSSRVQRQILPERSRNQQLMTAEQIVQCAQISDPKEFKGTMQRYINGPNRTDVFVHFPQEMRVGFMEKSIDPNKMRVGISKSSSEANWKALELLDVWGLQLFQTLPTDPDVPSQYLKITQGEWWTLEVPIGWLQGIGASNDPDKTKTCDINLDIRLRALVTKHDRVLKKFANGSLMYEREAPPAGSPPGTKGKYPDEAFEFAYVTKWSFSVEQYEGDIPQFYDDTSDLLSEN